jgi:hypothetical protein
LLDERGCNHYIKSKGCSVPYKGLKMSRGKSASSAEPLDPSGSWSYVKRYQIDSSNSVSQTTLFRLSWAVFLLSPTRLHSTRWISAKYSRSPDAE